MCTYWCHAHKLQSHVLLHVVQARAQEQQGTRTVQQQAINILLTHLLDDLPAHDARIHKQVVVGAGLHDLAGKQTPL